MPCDRGRCDPRSSRHGGGACHAISGHGVARVLKRLTHSRGLPKMIRTGNGKGFCGKAMVAWAHGRGVQ